MDSEWLSRWKSLRICVAGDVMLDRFVTGTVERVSPEAPIPVLHFQSERKMLGGAGNVARNVVALGGEAGLVGALGEDDEGKWIADRLCAEEGIVGHFVRTDATPTTVKTRFLAGGQQILRLDVERPLPADSEREREIASACAVALERASALTLSDYGKGVLTAVTVRQLIALGRARGVPVIVDPKSTDIERYAGARVLTPNAAETGKIVGYVCDNDESAAAAARAILDRAGVDAVVVTRGAQGMTIWDPGAGQKRPTHIPTVADEVFDVSGAGDTVAAALALALAAGAPLREAARIANAAAGVAVGKRGTAVVTQRELQAALGGGGDPKFVDNATALEIVNDWRDHGLKIGFTNGCFDLIHPGHVELLRRARATCDRLVVALNADVSVRRLKGPQRPLQNQRARSIVMAAIDGVDLVTLFTDDTPLALIEALAPDVLIKGSDYTLETVVGADLVLARGGKVALVPLEAGHSTTSIVTRAHADR